MIEIDPAKLKERLLDGASVVLLSVEFDVGENTIRRRISKLQLSDDERAKIRSFQRLEFDLQSLREKVMRGDTLAQISSVLDAAPTTVARQIAKLGLSEAEKIEARKARSGGTMVGVPSRFSGNNDLLRDIRSELKKRSSIPCSLSTLPNNEIGRVGENFVRYALSRAGIRYAEPAYNSDDLLVLGSDGIWKICEIKSAANTNLVGVNRIRYRKGEHVYVPYEKIDFFILVTLNTEEIFVIPAADMGHRRQVCCSPYGFGWKYRFKFDF